MKILLLHSEFIEWEPKKKAIGSAEKAEKKPVRVKDALCCFCSVEKPDEGKEKQVSENTVKEILDVAGKVKASNIVLYPYVHLTSEPSKPDSALRSLDLMEKGLKAKKVKVFRAPFGWYKAFNIKVRGHPLAELSRHITASGKATKKQMRSPAIEKEEDIDPHQLLRELSKTRMDRDGLKDNDHRILGQRMDLFSFSPAAPGMVFWHDKGWLLFNKLVEFWREEHRKVGYQEISTPIVMDKKLWQISGHWDKYRENIFISDYETRPFAVKPMNCPGGILVFKSRPKSYRDLPLRVAELGTVHRQELSGVLSGLFRVIQFTQDDAHIYCTEKQLESEIIGVIDMVHHFYKTFGFEYSVELSTRPEKRIGEDKLWDKAESVLESVLKKKKMKYKLNEGDGAFYGPKIDFHIKDSLGRTWQCATIQLDFAMPLRFEITYTGEDNSPKVPVMIHRTIYGAMERFIGVLLEHLNGKLPAWLAPVQVRVLSFTDRNEKATRKVHDKLLKAGIRSELDIQNHTVEYKVREAEMQKIPYILVIGDKEEKAGTIAVRSLGEKKVAFGVKLDSFIKKVSGEIENRK